MIVLKSRKESPAALNAEEEGIFSFNSATVAATLGDVIQEVGH